MSDRVRIDADTAHLCVLFDLASHTLRGYSTILRKLFGAEIEAVIFDQAVKLLQDRKDELVNKAAALVQVVPANELPK